MKGVLKKFAAVIICTIAIIAVLIGFGGTYTLIGQKSERGERNSVSPLSVKGEPIGYDTSDSLLTREDMLENALKSVVGISSADGAAGTSRETSWYMGSGVMVSDDGYIITNHHVIGARPERILVTLHNGKTTEGKTVWSSSALDLAVVKIDGKGFSSSKLGDAKSLRVGESVVAIGNPLSMQFERTVTAGIVSALGRSINIENEKGESFYMEDLIQTDASINPGNSGGPLLNSSGEVIGINTIKVSTAEGMGFAVPVNICIPIIQRLKNVGQFRTPYLGLYAYTPAAARYLGQSTDIENGLFVAKLDSKGPAFAAGIRYGDIITAINFVEVNTMLSLREELYKRQSGEEITIEFKRDGSTRRISVMLGSQE